MLLYTVLWIERVTLLKPEQIRGDWLGHNLLLFPIMPFIFSKFSLHATLCHLGTIYFSATYPVLGHSDGSLSKVPQIPIHL